MLFRSAVVAWLEAEGRPGAELEAYTGLFYQKPWLAGLMTLFLISLAGVAPTAGFMGKLLLLKAVLAAQAGLWGWALVAGLVVTTVISAFVYLRVVRQMVLQAPAQAAVMHAEVAAAQQGVPTSRWVLAGIGAVLLLSAWGTLQLGLWPQGLLPLTSGLVPVL